MNHYLVFDWGGTFLKYALMDQNAAIVEKHKVKTPPRNWSKEEFFSLMDTIVKPYMNQIEGIAISSPGIIDSTQGILKVVGVFSYLNGCNISREFEERYGVKTALENDAKSAALAELWKGNLHDCDDGAVFIIGTSIGGGIVLNHQLRRGKDFFAGEYSSMCIDYRHKDDRDGYMAQLGYEYLCQRVQKYLNLDEEIDGEQAFNYINDGNAEALRALHEYTDALALQLFNLNVMLNLERICIGGGISQQPLLMESLRKSIVGIRLYHPDIVGGIDLPLPVVDVCRYFNEANLIGALYHWFEVRGEK